MKKNAIVLLFIVLCILLISSVAYANSSWIWLTFLMPYNILPYAAVLTIALETFLICKFNHIKQTLKALIVICVANLTSFLLPYIYLINSSSYNGVLYELDSITSAMRAVERNVMHWPFYNVGIIFLLLTLVIEVPMVYFLIKKEDMNKKKFITSIILINILTTILVALVERILCRGIW